MPTHPPSAVLVDLDGTLVDTAPDIAVAVNRMLLDCGAAPLAFEAIRGFIGNGVPTLMRRVLGASAAAHPDAERLDEARAAALFHHHYRHANGRHGQVFPGVRAGLAALREAGCRLACVTNKPRAATDALLDIHALASWFEVVVAGDSLPQMKPSPEPLLHACRILGAGRAHCVLVGDSGVDVAAARAAGMPVYIVRYGYPGVDGQRVLECDGLLESLEDLPGLFSRVE